MANWGEKLNLLFIEVIEIIFCACLVGWLMAIFPVLYVFLQSSFDFVKTFVFSSPA